VPSPTTPPAIRALMITAVRNVIPTSLSSTRFVQYDQAMKFVDWCLKNIRGCFRKFQVRRMFEEEGVVVSNTDVREIGARWELLIAYPIDNRYAKNSGQVGRGIDDVLSEDIQLVDIAAGSEGYQNYNNTTPVITETKTVEFEGDKVAFIRLTIHTPHYQAS
jgi:hypothetical protein